MLPRIAYSVVVPVSVKLAFRAFQDLERLLDRGLYEEARWVQGEPWQVGSRIRYTITQPIKTTVRGVVTILEPPSLITLLNHAMGVTVEQHVSFTSSGADAAKVSMTMDSVGTANELTDEAAHEALVMYTHDMLDTMGALCEQWKSASCGR